MVLVIGHTLWGNKAFYTDGSGFNGALLAARCSGRGVGTARLVLKSMRIAVHVPLHNCQLLWVLLTQKLIIAAERKGVRGPFVCSRVVSLESVPSFMLVHLYGPTRMKGGDGCQK